MGHRHPVRGNLLVSHLPPLHPQSHPSPPAQPSSTRFRKQPVSPPASTGSCLPIQEKPLSAHLRTARISFRKPLSPPGHRSPPFRKPSVPRTLPFRKPPVSTCHRSAPFRKPPVSTCHCSIPFRKPLSATCHRCHRSKNSTVLPPAPRSTHQKTYLSPLLRIQKTTLSSTVTHRSSHRRKHCLPSCQPLCPQSETTCLTCQPLHPVQETTACPPPATQAAPPHSENTCLHLNPFQKTHPVSTCPPLLRPFRKPPVSHLPPPTSISETSLSATLPPLPPRFGHTPCPFQKTTLSLQPATARIRVQKTVLSVRRWRTAPLPFRNTSLSPRWNRLHAIQKNTCLTLPPAPSMPGSENSTCLHLPPLASRSEKPPVSTAPLIPFRKPTCLHLPPHPGSSVSEKPPAVSTAANRLLPGSGKRQPVSTCHRSSRFRKPPVSPATARSPFRKPSVSILPSTLHPPFRKPPGLHWPPGLHPV
nr:early nodulin-75-like [Penaeus vannamei]